jgi:nickel superoxide dismutase
MSFGKKALGLMTRTLSIEFGFAHCDIPCGIYDPIVAKMAAQTVLKMASRLEAVDLSGGVTKVEQPNSVTRMIRAKEEHAQKTKEELNILWSDYFKPDHLEKYPNLHELFWNANKLAGANKQNISSDSAKKLVDSVDEISKIFWATKGVDYNDSVADTRYGPK